MVDATTLWPFKPNWRSTYTISYEFKTDLFVADDGSEQRRALRSTPRKTIQFNALCYDAGLRRFNQLIDKSHNQTIAMPEVTRSVRTASPVVAGANRLTVDGPLPLWIAPNQEIVIVDPVAGYVLAKVVSVAGSLVQIAGTFGAMGAGTVIHPAIEGLLPPQLRAKRVTSGIAEVDVVFTATPGVERYDFGNPLSTVEGAEWLRLDHNWLEGLPVEHQWPLGQIDFGRGRTATYSAVNFPTTIRTYDMLVRDPAPLVQFFGRMRGRRGHFLISSMEDDMLPAGPVGGDSLLVKGTEIHDTYRLDPVRGMIEINVASLGRFARPVADMVIDNGNTRLLFEEPLPPIAQDQVLRISWLLCARLVSDTLEVVHTTTRAARILMNIQTLPLASGLGATLRTTTASDIRQTTDGADREVIGL